MDHDLPPTLHHPKNGWSFFLHRASSTLPFASASTTCAALMLHHRWLSLMASNHISFIAFHLVGEDHGWLFLQCHHAAQSSSDRHHSHGWTTRGQFAHSTHSAP